MRSIKTSLREGNGIINRRGRPMCLPFGRTRGFAPTFFLAMVFLFSPSLYAVPMERPNPDGKLNPAASIKLKIVSPEMNAIVEDSQIEVKFELENFEVRSGGPHLHYVLDNGMIREHFDGAEPIRLSSLSNGTHVVAIFPVTSWHESWKDEGSLALVQFHVQEESPYLPVDLKQPILIFNMPQGTVKKWKDRWVLFDFLVANVEIVEADTQMTDYRVRYYLDGAKGLAEYHESRFWLNIENGLHKIEVQLVDKKGQFASNGKWNWISRTFRIE